MVMFHKNHFFNLLVCALILLIYVQNYFDKLYMRITLIALGLAIVLDFMWLSVLSEVLYISYHVGLVESIWGKLTFRCPDWLFEV